MRYMTLVGWSHVDVQLLNSRAKVIVVRRIFFIVLCVLDVLLGYFAFPRVEARVEFYDLVAVLGELHGGIFASSA